MARCGGAGNREEIRDPHTCHNRLATLSAPLCSLPAAAGTISDPDILGFSADASIFVFAEQGIQAPAFPDHRRTAVAGRL